MGGGAGARSTLSIGWGEGMDAAARFLNEPLPEGNGQPIVASWHERSPFSYFFQGVSIPFEFFWSADYAVTYIGQEQRQLPSRQLSRYFAQQPPIEQIVLNGAEYAGIYKVDTLRESEFGVTWSLSLIHI